MGDPATSGSGGTASVATSGRGGNTAVATSGRGGNSDEPPVVPISEWPTDVGTKGGPFEWVGIIGSGQSLGVGCQSAAMSTTQPFSNVMLHDSGPDPQYPVNGAATAKWSLVPLVEAGRLHVPGYADDAQYPNNLCITDGKYGETPHSGFANTLSALWKDRGNGDYVTAHSITGRGGACMAQINKLDSMGTGRTYASGISEARVFKKFADEAGKTYGVAAILFTHGECDSQNKPYNPKYEEQLFQLWSDYNTDLKAVTGQTRDIVLLGSQQSSLPADNNAANVQLWRAGNDHPGKIVCVGPKYAYGDYGVHFTTASAYERLGEKYAEVYDYVVNRGAPWKPVGPNKVVRSGDVLTLTFDVPNPPLVWDSHLVAPHKTVHTAWAEGRGFEVTDSAGAEVTIASSEIKGNNVILTLTSPPASGLTVSYAITQDGSGWIGGYANGMHGLLRDSDDFAGYAKEDIDVMATKGSATVTAPDTVLVRRATFDIVSGPGVPDDTVAMKVTNTQVTLSSPWTGETGMTRMTFHHNHYNFGVHFSMPVP